MFEIYNVNGRRFEVSPEGKQAFLQKYPNAVYISGTVSLDEEKPAKKQTSLIEDIYGDTWLGEAFMRGYDAASTTGEANKLWMEGSQVTTESINNFIKAKQSEAESYVPSEKMSNFQKKYNEKGKTWTAWYELVKEDPALLAELFVQSLGTQAGTFADDPQARALTTTAFGTGFGYGATRPGDFRAKLIKGGGSALTASMGVLTASMETALTFGELIEKELAADGLEFNEKNVRNILTGPKGDSIRNKAIGRGLTIGTIEALTMSAAGKVTTGVLRTGGGVGTKLTATAAGVTTEMIGGGLGEIGGRLAAGQEMDPAEIGFEAVTGIVTAPGSVGYALATYKPAKYTLNSEVISFEKMQKFINEADEIDIAKANIKMENDMSGLNVEAYKKQNRAIIDNSIDEKITDRKDRDKLIELETRRQELERDKKKALHSQPPKVEENLKAVEEEIKSIIDQYGGAVGIFETKQGQEILQARQDITLQETIDFLQTNKKFVGKDVVVGNDINETQKAYKKAAEEYNLKNPNAKQYNVNMDITKSDGFVVGDVIVVNKAVAGQSGQINIGAHELLHGILKKHFKSLKPAEANTLIKEFRQTISKESNDYITTEFNRREKTGEKLDVTEWLTIYSDGIVKGDITFNESVSVKIKNFLQNIFRKFKYNKEFKSGLDTYNFMRDYQKSVAEGGLISKRAQKVAGGGTAATELTASVSETPLESINKLIPSDVKTKKDYDAFISDPRKNKKLFESITNEGGVINNYIRSRQLTQDEGDIMIEKVIDRVLKFNPDAKRKDGTRVGIKAFGERIFADTRYAKLDAKKDIAIDKKKESKTTRIDAAKRTKEGETTFDIEDTNVTPTDIDTQDMSPAARAKRKADKAAGKAKKTSKFRKELGIEKGTKTYKSVLDAARQSLLKAYEGGTTARNIQRKLRDQAVSYLFKSFKNFISYGVAEQTVPRGTKDIYFTQLKKFREAIVDVVFTADLVQLEKKVPDNEKIFTKFEKKLTRKADVEAAVEENKLPKEALNAYDKDKSVNLYKKIMPTEDKFIAFFNQPAVSPKTGLRSGLKGTRKDAVARLIAGALSYDATMQVAKEPDVVKKREDIAEIKKESDAVNSLETLAAQIHRDQDVDFSFSDLTDAQKNKAALYFADASNNLTGLPNRFVTVINELLDDGVGITEAYETARAETGIDSDVLDLVFKDGKFNKSHIKSIVSNIKKFGVAKVRKLGYDASVKFLTKEIAAAKGIDAKIELINDFLVNIGRPVRTAAAVDKITGLTTNESLLFDVIDKLGDKEISGLYKLADADIRGKKIVYTYNGITKAVPMYQNVENIKNNAYKSKKIRKTIKEEAKKARDYITKIVNDGTLSKVEKKAIVKLMGQDQRGALRKAFDLGMYVDRNILDLNSEQTILEHELTINDTTKEINSIIDNNKPEKALTDLLEKSKVHILPKRLDNILTKQGLKFKGSFERYNNKKFRDELKILIADGSIKNVTPQVRFQEKLNLNKNSKAAIQSRSVTKETKGITILDFDDTLATTKSMIRFTRPDGTVGKLNAEQYASTYESLLGKGYVFDFSEFNKVVKGKTAPLFNKAMKLQGKFGPKNMFVLTARPPESAKAIHAFLKANGLNIPLKNITGLANSTAEAKALWVSEKAMEGYNDFYFADDALQNVKAVKNMLNQFDVKSKVQQAKVEFSNSMDQEFNNILEEVTGIESKKRFSIVKGRKRGEKKGRFRFFVPPSHEDFIGLLYNFLGKGKRGDQHRGFFENALIRPLNRAFREIDTAKQSIANDFKNLNKKLFPEVKKILKKKTPDGDFTYEDAIRVYLWSKHGYKIPGLSPTDQQNLIDLVYDDDNLYNYTEHLDVISKQDAWVSPTDGWEAGDIRIDLDDAAKVGRKEYLKEFIENSEIIFSKENLNKIEAAYGQEMRVSIEDMLYRIETGINRPKGSNGTVNKFMNFLNGSIGSVMFFNMRSALLQQMSIVNYINFADNNIFAAGKAFANQQQFWTDFAYIFNSDMLKQRRGGLRTDINASELTETLSKSKYPARVLINQLLQLGFKPTQIGDSIAIAVGGASYYRNRVKTYQKSGLSLKEAEAKAFTDFQDATQSTQQSSRPDMVSKQQSSWIGKVILNFQNITSQYNRLGKKAMSDIYNRRTTKPNSSLFQSDISNASRIAYYFAIQNAIFYTLQTALFTMLFDDETEEENKLFLKKKDRIIHGSIDSILRGSGIVGATFSTLKNTYIAYQRQRDINYNPDESAVIMELANFSPVVGIKLRKVVNAEKTLNYNKKVIDEMETFDIDNPQWSAVTNYIEAGTNMPLNRLYNKTQNVRQALNNEHEAWQRMMMFFGWSQYNLGIQNENVEKVKQEIKENKKKNKKSKKKKKASKNKLNIEDYY